MVARGEDMSKNRQRLCSRPWLWLLLSLLWLKPLAVLPAWGDAPPTPAGPSAPSGKSAYVILSGEFFQAMEKLAGSGVVTGDRQEQLLEQIAVAQRFVVKTNLTLIEQHEKIIRLLEEIKRQGQGGGR